MIPNKTEFLDACEEYHRETRAPAFPMTMWIIHEKGRHVEGLAFLLSTWNQRWSGRSDLGSLEDQLQEALNETSRERSLLLNESLAEIDIQQYADAIETAYRKFRQQPTINKTGATKVLHALNPELFVMWDEPIRNAYHKRRSQTRHFRNHPFESSECYRLFLRDCQDIANALIDEAGSEQELISSHQHTVDELTKEVEEHFGYEETLAKMIDEYNYAKITLSDSSNQTSLS